MLTQSDNTAYNTMLDILDRREITKYVHDLGLVNSSVGSKLNLDDQQVTAEYVTPGFGDNVTTANDFATAFILIKGGRIPGSVPLEAILKQQKINNMIPLGLPPTVVVAHKTGDLAPLYHDGGIVIDKDRSYVLSIFSNAGSPDVVAHISKLIYSKDIGLVGQVLSSNDIAEKTDQPLDPLVMNPDTTQVVLGAAAAGNVTIPELTATDLGIKPEDLSLTIKQQALPKVVIPADAIAHPMVIAWMDLSEMLAIFPSVKAGVKMEHMKLELAEAVDMQNKGKKDQSLTLLNDVNKKLTEVVADQGVTNNTNLQTTAKAISETRFQIMGNALGAASPSDRSGIIKLIAAQAKDDVEKIEPAVPKAITATAPTQKPVVGQVVGENKNGLVVQTNSGQTVTVSANTEVNMRTHEQVAPIKQDISSVAVGTTVALVGTSQGNTFVPTFVMTNLPRQWVAPVPAVVLKVNTKNKTIVVSEEGKPTQVNLNSQSSIRGSDTNIPLNQVSVGDVVVVRGTAASPSGQVTNPVPTNVPTSITPKPNASGSPTPPPTATPGPAGKKLTGVTPTVKPVTPTTKPTTPTPTTQPQVIVGSAVVVIEKHQDVAKTPPAPKPTTPAPTNKPAPPPPATAAPAAPQPTDKPKAK